MKIVVPCAGRSSRFPNMPPKWMLPDHYGIPMVVRAVEGLKASPDDLVVTILREHEERFGAVAGLTRAFGQPVRCVVLDQPTASQSETVAETLRRAEIDEPFLVKDSDNFFAIEFTEEQYNYVTVASLNDFDQVNARNKSYVQIDQDGIITNIREKHVISDLFSVGGYFFRDAGEFLGTFDALNEQAKLNATELYLSEIIAHMTLHGHAFQTKRAKHYQDWGTVHEWRAALERRRVFLVSLDGFLFARGSQYFEPGFESVTPNEGALEVVRKMIAMQHTIVYLSIRPPEFADATRAQLAAIGLPSDNIVFGCGVAPWSLITASDPTLPFDTSRAFEVSADDVNLMEKLELSH